LPGYRKNQRFPGTSHATENACILPPGKRIRYCWSGSQPNVYATWNTVCFPSGPSVSIRNLLPSRKKRAFIPSPSKTAPEKSPLTVASVASAIARS
jgi:hypothetical protein